MNHMPVSAPLTDLEDKLYKPEAKHTVAAIMLRMTCLMMRLVVPRVSVANTQILDTIIQD